MVELLNLHSTLQTRHHEIQTDLSAVEAAIHFQRMVQSNDDFASHETLRHSTRDPDKGDTSSVIGSQRPFTSSSQSEYLIDTSGRIGANFRSAEYTFDSQSSSDSDSGSPAKEYIADDSYNMQSLTGSDNSAHRQITTTDPTECQDHIDSQSSRSSGGDEDFGYQSDASQQGDEHYETANSDSDHGDSEQAYEYSDGGNTYVDYSDDDY
ncbi:hypothetical protein EXIGLDRAFT_783289 [Exidia glandulosa HHB12029]|uniref:Uncharacterized protein n=1 Tax=Exidia glandulosa HHB12029 TaxID=1314781 RepID=A0A166N516_EXIGL|nr:hypothetical protein EXIGLDRAFT_783289 [Exidia glandulosa HHB12029]